MFWAYCRQPFPYPITEELRVIRWEQLHPACWKHVWPTTQIPVRQLRVFRLAK
jgi:hypothetical protein